MCESVVRVAPHDVVLCIYARVLAGFIDNLGSVSLRCLSAAVAAAVRWSCLGGGGRRSLAIAFDNFELNVCRGLVAASNAHNEYERCSRERSERAAAAEKAMEKSADRPEVNLICHFLFFY